jgi:hypothetical protein
MNVLKTSLMYLLNCMIVSFAAIGICTFYLLNAFDIIFLTYLLIVFSICIIVAYRTNKSKEKKTISALTPNCCVENYHK